MVSVGLGKLRKQGQQLQRASEFSGEQNLNGIQPERPSSSQCTPPLSQPHGVVSEARFSHGRSDGLAFLGGLAWFASVNCRHGERRPNQEQALHDVVKRGDRRESEAATGALAEPEGPGERAGRRARGQARRGAKEEDTVFGS